MESYSGTPTSTDGLRPLGEPRPVEVTIGASGEPTAVLLGRRLLTVDEVEEVWRIADAWWRDEPLARTYVRVVVQDGHRLTLFHDDLEPPADGWYEQRY